MFGNRNNRNGKGGSFINTMVNIATIVSSSITCISLVSSGFISYQVAAVIMFGVVVFVALGNNLSKIVMAVVGLFLFVAYNSHGSHAAFWQLMTAMLSLVLVLVGLYIMVRSIFKR